MTCEKCQAEVNVAYMCDVAMKQLCGPCFEQTDCGQNLHEEGCETMMVEGKEPELTAEEEVLQDEDLMWEAGKRFPLMHMNSREREKAIEWAIEQNQGGAR